MDKKSLEKKIEKSFVKDLCLSLYSNLQPNGAPIRIKTSVAKTASCSEHRKGNLIGVFSSRFNSYDSGNSPKYEIFSGYKLRDPIGYEKLVENILESVNSFGMKV